MQVVKASGDGDSLDDAQIFADGLSKPPSGPETGFLGTALMGGGGGGSTTTTTTTRRASPPLLPAQQSSGTIDVEAEIAAAKAQELLTGGGVVVGADGGGGGELAGAYLDCSMCTMRNSLTATRCTACNAALFS